MLGARGVPHLVRRIVASILVAVGGGGASLCAQTANPADMARPAEKPPAAPAAPATPERPAPAQTATQEEKRLHSWQMPPVVVTAERETYLREEDLIGPTQQPRWTARRRFGETRVYVIPEGQIEFEYWCVPTIPRKGNYEVKTQYEVEIGLPERFQLDLYGVTHKEGNVGPLEFDQAKFEVRWALADWGKIPGNPTLYAEWQANSNEPDHFEGKLLFGDEFAPRWHWGVNLVVENELGGDHSTAFEFNTGISYTAIDEKLSLGIETNSVLETLNGHGSTLDQRHSEHLVGPSVQWRPLPQMHIDATPLFGVTGPSPEAKLIFIIGWEF